MNKHNKSRAGLAVTIVLLIGAAASAGDDQRKATGDWTWDEQPGQSVALRHDNVVVWQFNYAAGQPKPYFHPVALPDGPVLTWDSPPDHPWHKALWFSWKYINKVNYWESDPKTGKSAGRTEWSNVNVVTRPDHGAHITMDVTYRDPDGTAVMTEHRSVDVSAPDATGEYHFDWTCRFTAGRQDVVLDRTPLPNEPGGKIYGGYAGLSVRFAKALTQCQATTTAGPAVFNKQKRHRSKASAMDYHGIIAGQPFGIAICDHPENLNHPTPWYAIASGTMSYFSPAVICYGPYTLGAGKTFTLRYRVHVHRGRWDAEQLRQAYTRFVQR